ncbi:unnamed protein product [Didymodactylos carnosus]|uniref:Uncharacterized protein n=1 Tax=Didymodactylos carnosus TaxID=1234261 RepID=A0A814Y964_9BILA|nr:unnamed protein product [Didymodactylos carnosus]CAF3989340.1 unnamed protein product [Didymodactylos carnosus]
MYSGQSVSGSSLLSDDDDARETSGRSRREFDEIDAVLFDESSPKRTSYKKIYDEWSAKPHFRIRGKMCEIETMPQQPQLRRKSQDKIDQECNKENMSTPLFDMSTKFTADDLNAASDLDNGRSSIDSIEGSELTNSDLDDQKDRDLDDNDQFTDGMKNNSFSTNDDDDEDSSQLSNRNLKNQRRKQQLQPPPSAAPPIRCMKDSVVSTLANLILKQFFIDYQPLFNRYAKLVCQKNGIILTPLPGISTTIIDRLPRSLRPYSLPPRSLSQNRFSLPTSTSITATTLMTSNNSIISSNTQDLIKGLRSTPDPSDISLTGLLRVTPCRFSNVYQTTPPITNATATSTNATTSPRKPPERILTSSAVEKRQPQINLISMIGTAVGSLAGNTSSVINIGNNLISLNISNNPSTASATAALTTTGTSSSSSGIPTSVTTIATFNTSNNSNSGNNNPNHRAWPSATSASTRYRSATIINDMRLPPITVEPLKVSLTSEQLQLHRSNTSTINSMNNNVGTVALISSNNNNNSTSFGIDRAVSGTSTGSNLSFCQAFPLSNNNSANLNNKLRTSNVLKFSARTLPPGDFVRGRPIEAHISRPVASAKDSIVTTTNLQSVTSPTRSVTRGSNSSNSRQTKLNNNTRAPKQQQQFSTPIKISAPHMW